MPRPKHSDPPVEWRVNVPESLAAQIELLLFDPVRNTIRYGGRSRLITALLREWAEKQRRPIPSEVDEG